MTLRKRYFLLALCLSVFFGLTPFLVLYVNGLKPSDQGGRFVNTGIVSVFVEPEDAILTVDGEEVSGSSPFSARFISAGERVVELKAEGFHTWKKKLFVESGRVTRVGSRAQPLQLLADSKPQVIAENYLDYALLSDSQMAVLTASKLEILRVKDLTPVLELKVPANIIQMQWSVDGQNVALMSDKEVWWATFPGKKLIKLEPERSQILNLNALGVLWKQAGNLMLWSASTGKSTLLAQQVANVFTDNSSVYAIINKTTTSELWLGSLLGGSLEPLVTDLPPDPNVQFWVTEDKQVFLLSFGALLRVDDGLTTIANGVKNVETTQGGFLLFSQSEVSYFDTFEHELHLLYRSSEAVNKAVVSRQMGYGFVGTEKGIVAVEIDKRDNQQVSQVAKVSDLKSLLIASDSRWLYWSEDAKLKRLELKRD